MQIIIVKELLASFNNPEYLTSLGILLAPNKPAEPITPPLAISILYSSVICGIRKTKYTAVGIIKTAMPINK